MVWTCLLVLRCYSTHLLLGQLLFDKGDSLRLGLLNLLTELLCFSEFSSRRCLSCTTLSLLLLIECLLCTYRRRLLLHLGDFNFKRIPNILSTHGNVRLELRGESVLRNGCLIDPHRHTWCIGGLHSQLVLFRQQYLMHIPSPLLIDHVLGDFILVDRRLDRNEPLILQFLWIID